ncbi:hypothetical protein PILCRDRAFT_689844 [Piloderma croceum F 1598]|uniref:Uncharacterized protein n=1 Tax=Piloderma croceum (strain F 1598) TaxID=765440 RepID=A0A0C3F4M7_PILCF|nr:hypothetical protein PILCRDRAFT_689844 [Piloderma croceum F 1598]
MLPCMVKIGRGPTYVYGTTVYVDFRKRAGCLPILMCMFAFRSPVRTKIATSLTKHPKVSLHTVFWNMMAILLDLAQCLSNLLYWICRQYL